MQIAAAIECQSMQKQKRLAARQAYVGRRMRDHYVPRLRNQLLAILPYQAVRRNCLKEVQAGIQQVDAPRSVWHPVTLSQQLHLGLYDGTGCVCEVHRVGSQPSILCQRRLQGSNGRAGIEAVTTIRDSSRRPASRTRDSSRRPARRPGDSSRRPARRTGGSSRRSARRTGGRSRRSASGSGPSPRRRKKFKKREKPKI